MTLPAMKKTYPKVLTFAFAGDLVIKKFNFLKVFQDKADIFYIQFQK